jgi:hypothetical protein
MGKILGRLALDPIAMSSIQGQGNTLILILSRALEVGLIR